MTVSPCEFPPRVLVTCVLSAISRNCNSFFSVLVLSLLIKSPYKTPSEILYVLTIFSPLRKCIWRFAFSTRMLSMGEESMSLNLFT